MPRSAAPLPNASIALAHHLADREGLKGAAREAFLRFMIESLGFDRQLRTNNWRLLAMVSFLLAAAGFGAEVMTGAPGSLLRGGLIWPAGALAGVLLAVFFRRAETQAPTVDRESHWRVYCLLLRPIVLAEKPGLLDRNLAADHGEAERIEIRPTETLRDMLTGCSGDFWWSGALGLWAGMFLLLAGRLTRLLSGDYWCMLPVAGMLLGPIVWTLWQCGAFWLARRQVRQLH